MINISIIVPTRQREVKLRRFIASIFETTDNMDNLEIIFVCDDDYPESINDIKRLEQICTFNHEILIRKRSEFSNRDYYNWAVPFTTGRYIWACADDLVFLHKGWDTLILERLDNFMDVHRDKIVCAVVRHNTHFVHGDASKIPSFPLISRQTYEEMGFLLHPELPTWGADHLLAELYSKVNRILTIDDVCFLNHISHHTKQIEADENTIRAGQICAKYAKNPENDMHWLLKNKVPQQVHQLRRYILSK